jgi:hypothetical protein
MGDQDSNAARTVCVISDPALKRKLRRTLKGTGSTVEFCDSVSDAAQQESPPNLLFLDQESRRKASVPHLLQAVGEDGKIVIIGESIADNEFVSLMRQQPLNHIVSNGDDFDEGELVVTSVKLLKGDIFGLDKYLSWGVDVQARTVRDYDQKRQALEQISAYAKQVGARRKVAARIENVADELLMNAIYDAPTAAQAGANQSWKFLSTRSKAAGLSYACDGRYFAIAVVDHYGELHKETILDNLIRAREEGGRPRQETAGAGLGIYFVLSSVTRYIANIQPGRKTEIICLFDLRESGKEAGNCARSLHIFTDDGDKPKKA